MRYQAAPLPDGSTEGIKPPSVVPPLHVKATLYADGGSRGNPGPAASGAVLFGADGEVLEEIGTFLGVTTNNVAEWTALLEGLKAALARGVDDLDVRMDSELVVKQLSGAYRVKHPGLIPLHAEAKSLLRRFARTDVRHVRRKENAAADAVVNQVLDAHRDTSPPSGG
jgi:ribonuclease HI